ncbi:hypothetical protein [Vampirovibrio chlorellavorus]|uniref:hypothetical protein n=1 Tax=Vampirovibrio chlorellavorus TaxID=758823 RepID=UPI0026F2A686|nr:hypothetical protein [Vampirovibrio chlorellavorus]
MAPSTQSGSASGVKFGGALLNGSVNTFQNITEVFLWGFLAQDMVAMWMPRVWTSLQEGKVSYDPSQDPAVKNKPFREQVGAWLSGNWKGLNWVNFYEGTKREIATGPGLLAVPAVAYMLNRATLNPSVELSAESIKGLGEGLQARVGKKTFTDKSELIAEAKQYLREGFADIEQVADHGLQAPHVKPETKIKAQKMAKDIQGLIRDWVNAEVNESVAFAENNGFTRVSNGFKRLVTKEKPSSKGEEAFKELKSKLWDFNREYRVNAYTQLGGVIEDTAPLNNTGKTWFTYRPDKLESGLVKQRNFAEIRNDVSRVGGFLNKLWANMEKEGQTVAGDVAEKTWKQLMRNKWLMGAGVTILTAAYLVKLAFWAQNHGTYQATRLLKEEEAAARKNHHHDNKRPGCQQPSVMPFQAGLPFGGEPAFSRWGQASVLNPAAPASLTHGRVSPFTAPLGLQRGGYASPTSRQWTEGGQA